MKALPPTLHLLRCLFSSFTSAVRKALSPLSVTYRFLLGESFRAKELNAGQALNFHCSPWGPQHGSFQCHQFLPCFKDLNFFCPLRHLAEKTKKPNALENLLIEWVHCSVWKGVFHSYKINGVWHRLQWSHHFSHYFEQFSYWATSFDLLCQLWLQLRTMNNRSTWTTNIQHCSNITHLVFFYNVLVNTFLIFPSPIKS